MSVAPIARAARLLSLFALAASVSCSDSSAGPIGVPSILIAPVTDAVYPGDVVTMRATVRAPSGGELPGAAVTWTVSDPTIAALAEGGVITALKAGTVRITATHEQATARYDLVVQVLPVVSIDVILPVPQMTAGDVTPIGVVVRGPGGRVVIGRAVTISSDDPAVATIDPAGRVRAVSTGVANIRATADGITGSARLEVVAAETRHVLSRYDGSPLPLLVHSDSVNYFGERELHETYAEGGTLRLTGGANPRYRIDVRYVEYAVFTVGGQRSMVVRFASSESDFGVVSYDGRGDLSLVSEYVSPLSHSASPESAGFRVRFRIPGDNQVLDLFYRREPR